MPSPSARPRKDDHRPFIGKPFIGTQLKRIAHLPRFPETQEAVNDLVTALGGSCWDEDHVRKVIDEVVYACSRGLPAPTAGDLRSIARNTAPPEAGKSWGCAKCDGTGWKQVEVNGVTGAKRCECHPGGSQ